MTLSRRKTLAILGGGAIVAAASAGGYAITRSPDTALRPWSLAGGYSEPRMQALSYAILAPNPHNRQPWIVDLSTADQVTLYVDTDRMLPHTDPFNRQITIGLGCFLEVMRIAALEAGWDVAFDIFPKGELSDALDSRPVAHCTFTKTDLPRDPLFDQVLHRRSLKEPYDVARPIPTDVLDRVLKAATRTEVAGTLEPKEIAFWRELTRDALRIELETPHTYKESVDLFRIGHREVDANPDGISFSGPLFEGMALVGAFSRDSALDTNSAVYKEGLKAVYANTDTGMGYLWLNTPGNSRRDQIEAGRDWVRLNLAATGAGLGMQPMSQPLQEYPEMATHYKAVHTKLASNGQTVQMLARLGYGPTVPQSPRWPLDAKIRNA